MRQEYYDEQDCSNCGAETPHYVYCDGHERDSFYDFVICLRCGGRKGGHADQHDPPNPDIIPLYLPNDPQLLPNLRIRV